MSETLFPKPLQDELQPAWNRYVDFVAPDRPDLHRYCVRLTGNVWDGEDLVQDTLVRVFAMLGKRWATIEQPRAYLARIATNLWIDRIRRRDRESAVLSSVREENEMAEPRSQASAADVRAAAESLLQRLAPRERAAVLLKDVFDLSLEETASLAQTSVAAVKAALHRGRERLEQDDHAGSRPSPPRDLVDRFIAAFNARDFAALQDIVRDDATVELVGGNEMHGRDDSADFFTHALGKFPGEDRYPRFEAMVFEGEPIVLGFRFWKGVEGLNDITRLETDADRVSAIRCYCWCPDTLRFFAEKLGVPANPRPYRSPTREEFAARFSAQPTLVKSRGAP